MHDDWTVKEVVEPKSGKTHRLYWYKGKICKRIPLDSHLARQMAGYVLIEKDMRSVGVWLKEIDRILIDDPKHKIGQHKFAENREKYNIVKGLFVAALTFYGKSFSKCEGRPVKLERGQLDPTFHNLHDDCMAFRHNFAAHSGAKKIERAEIALVLPPKHKSNGPPKLYREMTQPDFSYSTEGEKTFAALAEHARSIAYTKMERLNDKIMQEDVLPKGYEYWKKL